MKSGNPDRARDLRERAAHFQRLSGEAGDPVIHAELIRLALLYQAQAERVERGEDLPTDPGEGEA